MPRLVFPYVRPDPTTGSYPMIPVWLFNPAGQQRVQVYAIVDSGADLSMFDSALLQQLGLQTQGPANFPVSGVNTAAPVLGWSFDLWIGLATESSPEIFFPNGTNAVPTAFVPNMPVNLLGRRHLLDRCALTLNAWVGQVVLEF